MQDKINWELSLGLYPGLLIGFRTYNEKDFATHVLYMPFIDIALTVFNN